MEQPSPARLYSTVVGGLLALFGVAGFFASTEFSDPGLTGEALGLFAVNGWSNSFHLLLGLAGLAAAGRASRAYALAAGLILLGLGAWGVAAPVGTDLLGKLPALREVNALNLALGLLGVAAWAASRTWSRPQRRSRTSSTMRRSPEPR